MAGEVIKIEETKIGTPDSGTGGLTLCKGLALFPPFPTIPLGWQTKNSSALSIGHSFKVIVVKASAGGSFGVQAGLCGPSYAIRFNAEGEVEDGALTLTIKEDEAMGGIFFGAGMQAEAHLTAELYKVYWHWGPHGKWKVVLDIKLEAGIDVLKACLDILMALLQIEDMVAKGAVEGAAETPLAMIGEASDAYALNRGVIELDCAFSTPFNLWTILVLAALGTVEIPFVNVASAVIIAIHEALDVTLSSIGFGPTIGMSVPISVQIEDVSIDDVKFNRKTVTADGKWVGEQADRTVQVPAEPKEISFTMEHSAGFDFTVGLYAELQLVEIFHIGASLNTGILGLFNIVPTVGHFKHSLKNTIGSELLTAACASGCAARGVGLVDVDFI